MLNEIAPYVFTIAIGLLFALALLLVVCGFIAFFQSRADDKTRREYNARYGKK